MFNANNPRYKLNAAQIEEARKRYEECGWKILWIARFYGVDPKAIRFHAGHNGWTRRVLMEQQMPEEIAEIYRQRRKERYEKKNKGTYTYIQMNNQAKAMGACEHHRWVRRCSTCSAILGSDATEHNH